MGLGTYGRRGPEGQNAIETALEIGYRHLDTAQDYDTEAETGAALRASGLARDDVFVTTKVRTGNLGDGKVVPSVRQSQDMLGLDQIDLVLIHWPAPNNSIPLPVYVEQLAEVARLGLARHVGVSNFTIAMIDEARSILGDIPIFTNQVEVHPYLQNRKLVDHCLATGASITCYQPLAHGSVADDETLRDIGNRHGAGPDQVALAYLMQQDLCVIPSSANRERMQRNFDAQSIELDANDMDRIAGLERGWRRIDPGWGPDWD
ncbi:MAG: aldo/keto reductase [Hyphomicrobiaceae bacterium]|nr:aldo/keto reductase [Hyphomicrobiaceae bacterium]MCC0022768.1 aldo/keto reductase [Hyphomicrobiaceae bacterium]